MCILIQKIVRLQGLPILPVFTALFIVSTPFNAIGQTAANSSDIHRVDGANVLADHEAANASAAISGLFHPQGLPAAADVDAMHGLADGDILFSVESSIELDGKVFHPNDVIRFDGVTWTMEFDGSSNGIPHGANIDAIAVSSQGLLFSLDVGAELGSLTVTDSDIIRFSGSGFDLLLAASDVGIAAGADVDALHLDEQGNLFVSFDTGGQVGDIYYQDEDVLALMDSTWSLARNNSAADWVPADLDAWSLVFLNDILFYDSFESE